MAAAEVVPGLVGIGRRGGLAAVAHPHQMGQAAFVVAQFIYVFHVFLHTVLFSVILRLAKRLVGTLFYPFYF